MQKASAGMIIECSNKRHGLALPSASVIFLCLVLTSCSPGQPAAPTFKPTQNGFGVLVKPIGVDVGPGAALYYKGTNQNPVMVWPYIGTHGYPILYTNDVALLLADKPDDQGRLVNTALIAVKGAGPAMDISHDVLKIAAEGAHQDFNTALKLNQPLRLNQLEGKLEVYFVAELGSNGRDLKVEITWTQVFAIMEEVRKTGVPQKLTSTGVRYLQKDYGH